MVSLDVPAEDCIDITLNTSDQLLGSGCWQFNGSSSYVNLTDTLIRSGNWASGGSAFTIVYWWRTGTYDYVTCSQQCLTSTETEGDYLNSYQTYATFVGVNLGTTYHNDAWHQIAVRWDGSDLIASIDTSGTTATAGANITPPTWNTSTSTMALGAKFNSPNCATGAEGVIRSAYAFDGELDNMGIWNRTLTNEEIDALYNGGSGATIDSISTEDLLVYYNFEQAVDDGLINQVSGNGNGNITFPQIPKSNSIENSAFKS